MKSHFYLFYIVWEGKDRWVLVYILWCFWNSFFYYLYVYGIVFNAVFYTSLGFSDICSLVPLDLILHPHCLELHLSADLSLSLSI